MRAVTVQIIYRYMYMYMYIQCTYSMTTMFLNFSWSYTIIHVLMRDEKEERKKQARSNKQKRQSNTLKAVTFLKKLEPTTLYTIIHVSILYLFYCVCAACGGSAGQEETGGGAEVKETAAD